jgi:hypothetical protein
MARRRRNPSDRAQLVRSAKAKMRAGDLRGAVADAQAAGRLRKLTPQEAISIARLRGLHRRNAGGDDEQAAFARMPLAKAKRLVAAYRKRQRRGCFSAHLSKKRVGGTVGSLCDINPRRRRRRNPRTFASLIRDGDEAVVAVVNRYISTSPSLEEAAAKINIALGRDYGAADILAYIKRTRGATIRGRR